MSLDDDIIKAVSKYPGTDMVGFSDMVMRTVNVLVAQKRLCVRYNGTEKIYYTPEQIAENDAFQIADDLVTTCNELSLEEIRNLSLEMRCCYHVYPWNKMMTGNTVEEWAKQLGFSGYGGHDTPFEDQVSMAIDDANNLISFVGDLLNIKYDIRDVDPDTGIEEMQEAHELFMSEFRE